MLAQNAIIAANIAEKTILEQAQYMGWEDATVGERMRGSSYFIIDSFLWWVYVGAYRKAKSALGEPLDGCEFQLLPAWQREDWVGE